MRRMLKSAGNSKPSEKQFIGILFNAKPRTKKGESKEANFKSRITWITQFFVLLALLEGF